ncbi:hypothetical protein ACU4GD_13030 [Cupriavidus basilensis]
MPSPWWRGGRTWCARAPGAPGAGPRQRPPRTCGFADAACTCDGVDRDRGSVRAARGTLARVGYATRMAGPGAGHWPRLLVRGQLRRRSWGCGHELLCTGRYGALCCSMPWRRAAALLYETFAAGNETVGQPSNPAFPRCGAGTAGGRARRPLRVVGYRGRLSSQARPTAAFVQRLVQSGRTVEIRGQRAGPVVLPG